MSSLQVAVAAVALVAMLEVAQGHLCMIDPHQRGTMKKINTPGTADCQLTKAPCGGRLQEYYRLLYNPGQNITVTVQKNLNHFYAKNPGKFTVAVGNVGGKLVQLASLRDTKSPSGTLYTFHVTIPDMDGVAILQTTYVTNNPKAPPVFYQCADIMIASP